MRVHFFSNPATFRWKGVVMERLTLEFRSDRRFDRPGEFQMQAQKNGENGAKKSIYVLFRDEKTEPVNGEVWRCDVIRKISDGKSAMIFTVKLIERLFAPGEKVVCQFERNTS